MAVPRPACTCWKAGHPACVCWRGSRVNSSRRTPWGPDQSGPQRRTPLLHDNLVFTERHIDFHVVSQVFQKTQVRVTQAKLNFWIPSDKRTPENEYFSARNCGFASFSEDQSESDIRDHIISKAATSRGGRLTNPITIGSEWCYHV